MGIGTIGSTVLGQFVNTAVFYAVALSGVLPTSALVHAVLAGWGLKTLIEALMTPLTHLVIRDVKRVEWVDAFDEDTDFTPFRIAV